MTSLRYLEKWVLADLERKMVFLGGPRQVGKTTLAKGILAKYNLSEDIAYRNWDILSDRKELLQERLPLDPPLIALDEIHKFVRWRSFVKGFYDRYSPHRSLLVTGSARLDHFRKGGDSLQGRYHYYRLHPLSVSELLEHHKDSFDLERLLKFGGFPEPYFSASERDWRRWQLERQSRILYEDLRDLERVQEITKVELLVDALPSRVGSPLSLKSLAEDLLVAHSTVERWLGILENLYLCFRISPFGSPKIRAVKKEQKIYLWDWSVIEDAGARFENLVASHLLKYCHFVQDTDGHLMELRFVRDTDKREVDFVVLKNKKPIFAVEAKVSDKSLSPHLRYFAERTEIPKFYQTHLGSAVYGDPEIEGRVLPFVDLCRELSLP
ncbi:MAG: ATP-binding protein [Pseudomonadota bacterium]